MKNQSLHPKLYLSIFKYGPDCNLDEIEAKHRFTCFARKLRKCKIISYAMYDWIFDKVWRDCD